MSNMVIDRSILFHRKIFIVILIIASFVCFYLTAQEFAKVACYLLIVVAIWFIFPLHLSYWNFSYLEKNKKILKNMNLQVHDSCILVKN